MFLYTVPHRLYSAIDHSRCEADLAFLNSESVSPFHLVAPFYSSRLDLSKLGVYLLAKAEIIQENHRQISDIVKSFLATYGLPAKVSKRGVK